MPGDPIPGLGDVMIARLRPVAIGMLAALGAISGALTVAVAMLGTVTGNSPPLTVVVIGFVMLAASTFMLSLELVSWAATVATLGMIVVATGTGIALLAGMQFQESGNVWLIGVTGIATAIVFIAAPIIALLAARAGVTDSRSALLLTGASVLVVVFGSDRNSIPAAASYLCYASAWVSIGVSLWTRARASIAS